MDAKSANRSGNGRGDKPLSGIRILTLALNVPGPVAAYRLSTLGAAVTKIEPPAGDPLALVAPDWYQTMIATQDVHTLDLKTEHGRARLDTLLSACDLLLTSFRPAALDRLELGWPTLESRYPSLLQVAITGYPRPLENRPGHDLTYMAGLGLLAPPENPRTLLADMAGSEMAVSAALALLLGRERGATQTRYREVPLSAAADHFALPFSHGLTRPGGPLSGAFAGYRIYETASGRIALAAIEPHFWQRLMDALDLPSADIPTLTRIFKERTAAAWVAWATEHDLPLAAVAGPD